MKFSNFFALGLATLSFASPVEKREATSVSSTENSVTSEIGNLDNTVGVIIGDVANLLGKIVTDVEDIASTAGIDVTEILTQSGISLSKRSENEGGEVKRSDQAVEAKVETLIADILGELVTLSASSGVSLIGTILSVLKL